MTANPHEGEHSFSVGGKDYIIALDWRGLAAAEKYADRSSGWLLTNLDWLTAIEALFVGGMGRHHKGMSVDQIRALLMDLTVPKAREVIEAALAAAFPKKDDDARP